MPKDQTEERVTEPGDLGDLSADEYNDRWYTVQSELRAAIGGAVEKMKFGDPNELKAARTEVGHMITEIMMEIL